MEIQALNKTQEKTGIKSKKLILGAIAGVLLVFVLLKLIFIPNLSKISESKIKIQEQREKLEKAEEDVSNIQKIKSNIKKIEDKVNAYQAEIPQYTPDWLLGKLNMIAAETGIDFGRIEPKADFSKLGSYELHSMYLEFKTDYHRLGAFINKLENLSLFLKVLDLSIVTNKDDITKHDVKLTVGAYISEEK